MSVIHFTPQFSMEEAHQIAEDRFGVSCRDILRLPSERDQNFLLHLSDGRQVVLKISNAAESEKLLAAQNTLMRICAEQLNVCPRPLQSKQQANLASNAESKFVTGPNKESEGVHEAYIVRIAGHAGLKHCVRLVTFLPGQPLSKVRVRTPELWESLGELLGRLTNTMQRIAPESVAALEREFIWDLSLAEQVLCARQAILRTHPLAEQIDYFRALFRDRVIPVANRLPRGPLHNDANDDNLLVYVEAEVPSHVCGLIDFGDAVCGWYVSELAIALAYAMLDSPEPLDVAGAIVRGYVRQRPLADDELQVLFPLAAMRQCMSAAIAAEQQEMRPDNPYLSTSQSAIQRTLPRLRQIPPALAAARLRSAADREAGPAC